MKMTDKQLIEVLFIIVDKKVGMSNFHVWYTYGNLDKYNESQLNIELTQKEWDLLVKFDKYYYVRRIKEAAEKGNPIAKQIMENLENEN